MQAERALEFFLAAADAGQLREYAQLDGGQHGLGRPETHAQLQQALR